MKTLLSDDLWSKLREQFKNHKRIRAAIAYVTTSHLNFKKGDLLVCDASDQAIKGGLTSAAILRSFFKQGAKIYSYTGLHSKVAVIDDDALIGSANLSENAGIATCEASLLTDDPQIAGLINGFVEQVKREATHVTQAFLLHIESLPVIRIGAISRKSKKKVDVGRSRVWFVATTTLSERLIESEKHFVTVGTEEAKKRLSSDKYEIDWIRWHGKSRFRSEAKPGDLIIQAHKEKRGTRKYIEIYKPAPILHRQDKNKWTRFYLEVPTEPEYYLWKYIKADFRSLGITNITPNTTRELTGKALGIIQLME